MIWLYVAVGPGPHATGTDWIIWAVTGVVVTCIGLPFVFRYNRKKRANDHRTRYTVRGKEIPPEN